MTTQGTLARGVTDVGSFSLAPHWVLFSGGDSSLPRCYVVVIGSPLSTRPASGTASPQKAFDPIPSASDWAPVASVNIFEEYAKAHNRDDRSGVGSAALVRRINSSLEAPWSTGALRLCGPSGSPVFPDWPLVTTRLPELALSPVTAPRSGSGGKGERVDCAKDESLTQPVSQYEFRSEIDPLADLPDEAYDENPTRYLERAVTKALLDPSLGSLITRKLFPRLLVKSPARRQLVHHALRAFALPEDILQASLEQYRASGYEGRLMAAASLLHDLGHVSWPTLLSLAKSRLPESHAFVGVIVTLEGIQAEERVRAIAELTRNPNPETRSRVLEVWEEWKDLPGARGILAELAVREGEDDSVREAAEDQLKRMDA